MRDFNEMEYVDLRLDLLSGSSLYADGIEILPYTIHEIRKYGYSKYMRNLQWITITVDDFIRSIEDIEKRMILEAERSNLKSFDFYTRLGGTEMFEGMMDALAMIFKTDDIRLIEQGVIGVDFMRKGIIVENDNGDLEIDQEKLESFDENDLILVHRDNFDQIVTAVKIINFLEKPSDKKSEGENPADESTRQLIEQMKKNKEKVQNAKKREKEDSDTDDIDISDIVSSVTVKSRSLNKFNIWNLTLFQLYEEYARLELIDNYDFSIRAMMAGAEEIDLKHWSSRL